MRPFKLAMPPLSLCSAATFFCKHCRFISADQPPMPLAPLSFIPCVWPIILMRRQSEVAAVAVDAPAIWGGGACATRVVAGDVAVACSPACSSRVSWPYMAARCR